MTTHQPPIFLRTLNQKPTWHNRAGNTDRSACFELKASTIWPLIPTRNFTTKRKSSPQTKGHLIAVAQFTLTIELLTDISKKQKPFQLQGDLRTKKSNAMKNNALPLSNHLHPNPNKGATSQKSLGLPLTPHPITYQPLWTQILTIQKWKYPINKKIKTYHGLQQASRIQHYLQCPTCSSSAQCLLNKHGKLFLPLCTKEEIHDAITAQSYIKNQIHHNPKSNNAPPTQQEIKLINRYAPLFHPRIFQCKNCLHLRYGEIKK